MLNILVLEEFAARYSEYLQGLDDQVTYAQTVDDAGRNYDVLLAQPDLAAEYLAEGGRVHWIQSTWAGIRPLADTPASESVLLTGIKDLFGPQIADYVFTYVLDEVRTPQRYRRAQEAQQWQQVLPQTTASRHMLIVGTGSIGRHLAKVAQAFDMTVSGVSRSGDPFPEFSSVLPVQDLRQAVAGADYVVLTLPDTMATYKLFDHEVFAAMTASPMLINVGRGTTVDDDALLTALREGQVRHAVLDVFHTEPLPAENPLWHEPGVTITPHIAAVSFPADICRIFLQNLKLFKAGAPLLYVLESGRGY